VQGIKVSASRILRHRIKDKQANEQGVPCVSRKSGLPYEASLKERLCIFYELAAVRSLEGNRCWWLRKW